MAKARRKFTRREILQYLKNRGLTSLQDLKTECREMEKFLPILKFAGRGSTAANDEKREIYLNGRCIKNNYGSHRNSKGVSHGA